MCSWKWKTSSFQHTHHYFYEFLLFYFKTKNFIAARYWVNSTVENTRRIQTAWKEWMNIHGIKFWVCSFKRWNTKMRYEYWFLYCLVGVTFSSFQSTHISFFKKFFFVFHTPNNRTVCFNKKIDSHQRWKSGRVLRNKWKVLLTFLLLSKKHEQKLVSAPNMSTLVRLRVNFKTHRCAFVHWELDFFNRVITFVKYLLLLNHLKQRIISMNDNFLLSIILPHVKFKWPVNNIWIVRSK